MGGNHSLLEARFFLNMKRFGALANLVTPASPGDQSSPLDSSVQDDISRTAVVFLHATFEDMLRTAARQRPDAIGSEDLNRIPLSGASGRAEKFYLGALHAHRGKTVDEVLRESVEAYWERVTFGSCDDVEKALRQMGLDTGPFKVLYAGLDSMMKRRHQIVHDADLENATDRVARQWSLSDTLLLTYWLLHVLTFHAQLHVSLDSQNEVQRWYLEKRTKAIERARQMILDLLRLAKGPTESLVSGFQVMAEQVREVIALLGPPSEDEIREIASRMGIEA
jgi:hypothetical protein